MSPRAQRRSLAGKSADLGDTYFRSSWERNVARVLNERLAEGSIVGWEFEPQHFVFPVKRGNRAYLPDFRVWLSPTEYEWWEVKGWMDEKSRIKLKRFQIHYPDEWARFVLIDKPAYKALEVLYKPLLEAWE